MGRGSKKLFKNVVGRTARMTVNSVMKIARTAYETFTGERLEQIVINIVEEFLDVHIVLSNSGPSE